ncbi:hypothetical protein KDH_39990 [Dictyobacter sp. S3.2.2.5]|uniref:histidine kinase n=2 Tax=Dictyobacter halimunensis TaxID=3026934 RepID=A0ABQ6FU40_9CHLR|nr:hypothetical protein KDH_39990 [Dictyobacter sp. S3.2.2.5]
MWLYALIVIIFAHSTYIDSQAIKYGSMATLLLVITFIETLIVTLYAPVLRILFPRLLSGPVRSPKGQPGSFRHRQEDEEGEAELIPPLAQTRNHYWNITIYTMDVIICGLVMYFSAPFLNPPFGLGSPFYRYGMSTVFAAAAAFRYRGGLLAALGYDLFALLGLFIHAPGAVNYTPNAVDIAGSLVDTPIVAILVAYLSNLLENYARSKRQERENARTQAALVHIGEALLQGSGDRQQLLQRSLKSIQRGRFDRLTIALIDLARDDTTARVPLHLAPMLIRQENTFTVDQLPDNSTRLIQKVLQTKQKLLTFEPIEQENRGIARLYLPLLKDEHAQLVLGAESLRMTPFNMQHEKFLTIAGTQLLVALDNIRLAEQTVRLAADAERGRIAREIHDGIAQLTYMLSLQAETCQAQAQRIIEASEEDAELLSPLAERLSKMVMISKQALWETRNYMFSLKPLMSGTTTLTQMLSNQLREFEAISDIPTQLHLEGSDDIYDEARLRSRRYAQIGTTFFRIVQEALTNAYKHAGASQLDVVIRYQPEQIEVDIRDNGRGFPLSDMRDIRQTPEAPQILSGHGIKGMRERASELGGHFTIVPQPDGGTTVRVGIPF